MAAPYLKRKQSKSFGLNYTNKVRPSAPPFRQNLPGSFPWLDKAAQTELSLILDSDKTVAVLLSIKQEMMAVREEVKLAKKYLQSEYEYLLQNKSMELTKQVNNSLAFMETVYKQRVNALKHAFRQQMADFLMKENATRAKEGAQLVSGEDGEESVALVDVAGFRRREIALKDQLQKRDDAMGVMKAKLNQYTQQQQHLQTIQQQQQQHLITLQSKKTNTRIVSLTGLDEREEEDDVENDYRLAKLGEMHQLKVKQQTEMKQMIKELEKLRHSSTNFEELMSRKEIQLNTLTFELDRLKSRINENDELMVTLKQQLKESNQSIENERAEAVRLVNEIKNKMAQEAERQERRRKWQMFMQDPSKILSKKAEMTSTGDVTAPESVKDEFFRIAIENEWPVEVWEQLRDIVKQQLDEVDGGGLTATDPSDTAVSSRSGRSAKV